MIVFLGNPGKQYKNTRHNIGFSLCDYKYPSTSFQKKFNSLFANEKGLKLLKPQTFMNKSGLPVQAAASFFSIKSDEIIIVHDDLELPFGEIKIQQGGGLKGHNGLKSIQTHLNSDNFYRLRFGIGRPNHNNVSSFVLSSFDSDEKIALSIYLEKASELLEQAINKN